jgi:cytochrome c oxidase subunit 2
MNLPSLIPLRPFDASYDGFHNDVLFARSALTMSLLFIAVSVILIVIIFGHREGRHRPRYRTGSGRRQTMLSLGVIGVIFLGFDGSLLVDGELNLERVLLKFPDPAEHPLEIEILAQQWAWNVRYAGRDGQFGTPDDVVTLNDLHMPVDRPVIVHLRSKDVVHSFYLPNFRVKQDVLPGAETRAWFRAKRTGTYEIGCAQHCGASHYKMHGLITVTAPGEFDAWLAAAVADADKRYDAEDADAHWGWPWM